MAQALRRLAGRTALVTGGSSGIGRATAELFAREGAAVAVASGSSLERAREVADAIAAAGGRAAAVCMDVRSTSSIIAAVAEVETALGPVDVLVNCAGTYVPTPLGATDEATFDDLVAVNLKGTFFTVQAVAAGMKARRAGRIVNVASAAAFRGSELYSVYSAVKAGVVMLTRGLARDLAPYGVACNAVAPGNTATPLNAGDRASPAVMEAKRRAAPGPRVYSPPEEMAEAILFLADGRAKAAVGSVILLDEGVGA